MDRIDIAAAEQDVAKLIKLARAEHIALARLQARAEHTALARLQVSTDRTAATSNAINRRQDACTRAVRGLNAAGRPELSGWVTDEYALARRTREGRQLGRPRLELESRLAAVRRDLRNAHHQAVTGWDQVEA